MLDELFSDSGLRPIVKQSNKEITNKRKEYLCEKAEKLFNSAIASVDARKSRQAIEFVKKTLKELGTDYASLRSKSSLSSLDIELIKIVNVTNSSKELLQQPKSIYR